MTLKKASRIKNYTTVLTVEQSVAHINQALARHRARRMTFDYDDEGRMTALHFTIEVRKQPLLFRLPVNLAVVEAKILEAYPDRSRITETLREQAYRTAWANVKDWVIAQMTFIDMNGVKTEEVFFPYLVNQEGKTYFEAFEERLALPSPSEHSAGSWTVVEER